jgi:ABC-type lipoprotein release transport system permease subunit
MAWRNVWRNPRRSGVVISAVAVGVAGALLAMSVTYGMGLQMVETAISTDLGHVQIHASGYDANPELQVRMLDGGQQALSVVSDVPGVRAFAQRVRGEGLVTSTRASAGVRVIGVEPEREREVSIVADSITAGRYLDGTERRVLIGERLARRLQVDLGDKLVVSVTDLAGDLTGLGVRVGGLFHTPSSVVDGNVVFLLLADSRSLLGLGDAISEIVVIGEEATGVDALRDRLQERLAALEVTSWKQAEPLLDYLIGFFDQIGYYLYGAVFVAMLFGIANVLLMAIHERIREIGVLMAIGMSRGRLATAIVGESLIVTGVGLVIGYAVAIAVVLAFRDGIDLSRVSAGLEAFGVGQRIVPVLRTDDFLIPTLVATATAAAASAWPVYRVTRLRPAEAVRHT